MFIAPGEEFSIGTAVWVISLLLILIMIFRLWLKSARMVDSIADEIIKLEKNKIVKKNYRWEDR